MRKRYIWDSAKKRIIECKDIVSHKGLTIIPDTKEFVTENITGKPVAIHGRRQKKILMKANKVVEWSPMKDKRDTHAAETEQMVAKLKEQGRWDFDSPKGFEAING